MACEKGVSAHVGDEKHRRPSVHWLDAARVYRLALERGARNGACHAVAEEGVPYREIAEAIGRQLGVPTRSLTREEAAMHFGDLAMFVENGGSASSKWTREDSWLGTREAGIVADIQQPDYSE